MKITDKPQDDAPEVDTTTPATEPAAPATGTADAAAEQAQTIREQAAAAQDEHDHEHGDPPPPYPEEVWDAITQRDHAPSPERRRRHEEIVAACLTATLGSGQGTIQQRITAAFDAADATLVYEELRYSLRGLPARPRVPR